MDFSRFPDLLALGAFAGAGAVALLGARRWRAMPLLYRPLALLALTALGIVALGIGWWLGGIMEIHPGLLGTASFCILAARYWEPLLRYMRGF